MSSDALADYVVFVRTGDRKRAGTDANIRVILHGNTGLKTEKIHLHHVLKNDFECGQVDEFDIQNQRDVGTVVKIELWRDNFGLGSRWYCDYVIVKKKGHETEFSFPIFRWIKADVHYMFRQNDTMLPQQDPMAEQRWKELKSKKKKYEVAQKFPNGPAQRVSDD
ncbi:hypothetical protein DPMN_159607 [Dreissena polymorpha]|uniref:PLAT domain-containing protein n=1 Tax=Dreissena polymorpha TaxID=45954 RepID=A0A9D4EJC6_DREPO|nr:hypothetical protein DPMN_159607 [Dreissena polymorpha]